MERSVNLFTAVSASILVAAGLAGCTTAQPLQSAPRQQTWEEFKRDHPDTFIAGYRQSLAVEAARLRAAGLGEDLDVVRALVSAYLPPG